ncbi:MAG: MG2 domain-containing protein, partial [Alphaproteobacteria bacterium]
MRYAMLIGAVLLGLAAAAVALVDPAPSPAVTKTAETPAASVPAAEAGFVYRHYTVDTTKPSPEACLVFSEPLGEGTLADYVRVTGASPAIRVDGASLCLAGLAFGKDYRIAIADGLPAASGRRLEKAQQDVVTLGERPAFVGFSGNGYVLPRRTTSGLPIETVNVSEVSIKVLRVGDRLLARELRETWTGGRLYRYAVESLEEDRGTLVWQGSMAVERHHNQRVVTQFPLAEAIKDRKPGAYLVVVENADRRAAPEEDRWGPVASRWVVDTDIGLTALSGADGLTVHARSLATAAPMAGARLALIATNNDELGIVTTDAEGVARFAPGLLRGKGGATPSVAMAYADGDFALIDLKRPAFDLSDRGVEGRPAPGPVDAFLYADRGVYRPGEQAHVVALLRDRLGFALEGQRTTLVVRRPNGTEFGRFPRAAEGAGAVPLELDLPKSAARGVWAVEAYLDVADAPVGRAEFEVQDFVPQRLAVDLASPDTVLRPGDMATVTLSGRFLYGAPAADLPVEAELKVEELHSLPQAKGYLFGRFDDRFEPVFLPLDAEMSDAEGQATATGRLDLSNPGNRPLRAVITAGMVEPGGRTTKSELVLPVA